MLSELLTGSVPLQAYLLVAAVLFCTGVWGLINSRNAVRVLMSIELMLNAVNINLMAFFVLCRWPTHSWPGVRGVCDHSCSS